MTSGFQGAEVQENMFFTSAPGKFKWAESASSNSIHYVIGRAGSQVIVRDLEDSRISLSANEQLCLWKASAAGEVVLPGSSAVRVVTDLF